MKVNKSRGFAVLTSHRTECAVPGVETLTGRRAPRGLAWWRWRIQADGLRGDRVHAGVRLAVVSTGRRTLYGIRSNPSFAQYIENALSFTIIRSVSHSTRNENVTGIHRPREPVAIVYNCSRSKRARKCAARARDM